LESKLCPDPDQVADWQRGGTDYGWMTKEVASLEARPYRSLGAGLSTPRPPSSACNVALNCAEGGALRKPGQISPPAFWWSSCLAPHVACEAATA
jgi:hypothetical protein